MISPCSLSRVHSPVEAGRELQEHLGLGVLWATLGEAFAVPVHVHVQRVDGIDLVPEPIVDGGVVVERLDEVRLEPGGCIGAKTVQRVVYLPHAVDCDLPHRHVWLARLDIQLLGRFDHLLVQRDILSDATLLGGSLHVVRLVCHATVSIEQGDFCFEFVTSDLTDTINTTSALYRLPDAEFTTKSPVADDALPHESRARSGQSKANDFVLKHKPFLLLGFYCHFPFSKDQRRMDFGRWIEKCSMAKKNKSNF